jgi:hypothetical protein
MRPDDLLFWMRAAPFRPFRLHLVGGRSDDIRHPEMLRVGRTSAIVFSFSGSPDPFEHIVSLVLIERMEPIEATAAA